MKKNDIVIAEIENVGSEGEGVFHIDGATVFAPFVLPSEKAEIRILKTKDKIAFGKLEKLLVASKNRVEPKCSVFKKCGGCQLQHANYQTQLEIKKNTVKTCLKKIAKIDFEIENVVPSQKVWGYRNKLQLPIRHTPLGNKIGFFRENSHDVVEISSCPLHGEWADKLIECVKNYIDSNNISCFDDSTSQGLLKHIVARYVNNEILIVIVATKSSIPQVNLLIEGLSLIFDKFSLVLNVNNLNNNVVFGDKFINLFGNGKIALCEFGITYDIGAQSFMQVNDEQKINMYNKVFSCANISKNSIVIDGYSGAGVLTAMLAKNAKKAYGVEIIAEAVESANKLAKLNGLQNVMESICGDCAEILPKLISKAQQNNNSTVLVLDPPRKGVAVEILSEILKSTPNKIIYISCSPQSLARDLGVICGTLAIENNKIVMSNKKESIYQIESITPFDLFPSTKHIETLVCLSKK